MSDEVKALTAETRTGRPQRWWDAHRQGLIDRLRKESPRGGGQYFERHPWTTMREAADELERLAADLDAGQEWMRVAWNELNAIRARDGAPPGVSEQWWDEMTEGLSNLLGDGAKPWMLGAARELVEPYRRALSAEQDAHTAAHDDWLECGKLLDEARQRIAALEADRDAAFARGKAEGIEAAAKDLESECWGPGRCTAITLKDGSCIEQFCPHRSAANIRALSPAAEQEKARELKEDLGDGRWADVEPAALSEAPTDGK